MLFLVKSLISFQKVFQLPRVIASGHYNSSQIELDYLGY
ncbi:hypothetical protein SCRDD08_01618 [Streptococcus cristatus]|uniref:Uncharacterized protein n=1 Tax=Streptococcus cristatus TaxID=45634 RepID=A0A139MZH3_STRCR|nr:hypothetical protein SCRDD08_01618 [Streptococcus cristatus]